MHKAASIAGFAVWLAAAFTPQPAFAEDQHIRDIEERLSRLRREPPTVDDLDKLVQRLTGCWDIAPEIAKTPGLVVTVRIDLKRDGSLAAPPVVINHSENPLFNKAAESAIRAVRKCAPFGFLPAATYEQWKALVVDFDPHTLVFPPH